MTSTTANEFKKYQDIRHIARRIAEGVATPDKVEQATDELVEFAGAIASQDLTGYATKTDFKELDHKIDLLGEKVNAMPDKITVRFGLMIIGTLGVIKTAQVMGWW